MFFFRLSNLVCTWVGVSNPICSQMSSLNSLSFRVVCKISLSIFPAFVCVCFFCYKSVSSGRFPTTKPTFFVPLLFLSQSIGNFYLLSYHSPSEFSHFCYLSLSDSLCLCHWVFVFSPSLSFTFINLFFTLNSAIICFFFVLLYINVSPLLSKSQHQIILFFVFFLLRRIFKPLPHLEMTTVFSPFVYSLSITFRTNLPNLVGHQWRARSLSFRSHTFLF